MQRLRKILLNPSSKYDKLDDRLLGHNLQNMGERTDAAHAPKVQILPIPVGGNAIRLEKVQHPSFP